MNIDYQLVYQLFPRSFGITEEIQGVISCFEKNYHLIKSPDFNLNSDGVLKVISEKLGIERGHIETIHSYTNDQNLLDNYHAKYRRGRSAALNMVITETGADKAVAKVLPHLAGLLTGNAVRVPTPDVSLAILNLNISKNSSKEEVNEIMREAALNGELVEQIQYSNSNELVSTDLVGNPCASIFDSPATIVSKDGKSLVLYVWYDNEYGYTRQVIRLSKELAGVIRMRYY
jgi:glyceraldehyde 3-phosphate dehydrogenase